MAKRRFTAEQVREIRKRWADRHRVPICLHCGQRPRLTLETLAGQYGVSMVTMCLLLRGRNYRWVT